MSGVFLRQGDDYVAMTEAPYEQETVLQELLARYPALLAGGESGEGDLLLVRREASVALGGVGGPRGSLDHLFVNAAGIPVLVEVKRSADSRIRREVVGQLLDYAANAAANWGGDGLRQLFERRCAESGGDPADIVREALETVSDVDAFWATVRANVAAERLRLVFVADAIPSELRRIVEYLNGQMTETEVVAIEVKQYRDADGVHQTLVPRILGDTEAARQAKGRVPARRWDRTSMLAKIEERVGVDGVDVARRLFEWVDARGDLRDYFGNGSKDGSFQAGYGDQPRYLWPFVLYTYGRVEVQFQYLKKRPPFDRLDLREELRSKLAAIPGFDLPPAAEARRPAVDLTALAPAEPFAAFTGAMDWAFAQATAASETA
jgi:hypothetical protein